MKKLILYITSVIAAVALLIYVVNFAVKILGLYQIITERQELTNM